MTEDEIVGWHRQLNGHEFEQTLGDSEGQGSLACCSPRACKELNNLVTEQQQLVVRTRYFHCRARGSIPGWGTEILQDSQGSQKKNQTNKLGLRTVSSSLGGGGEEGSGMKY